MKITLLSLLLMAVSAFGGENVEIWNYYYIPLGVETYEAITLKNIREKSESKGELSAGDASKIIGLLAEKQKIATFDNKRVRLLVETQNGKIFILVDSAATVMNGKDEYALKPSAIEALKKMLNSLKSSR